MSNPQRKTKGKKVDLGKSGAYRYHEKLQGGNRKIVQSLSEVWYPESAVVEELFVLRKVYEMAGHKDGRLVNIGKQNDAAAFLYLTSEFCFDGNLYYRDEDCLRRAMLRHEDFISRRLLVSSNVDWAGLSFSGKLRMESLIQSENRDDILHMVSNFNSSVDKIDYDLVEISQKISMLIEHMDSHYKFSVADGVGMAGGICSILSSTSTVANVIDKLLPGIRNMLFGIQSVLKNI